VSKACKVIGYSRQQLYEICRYFQTYGADGLIDRLPDPRNPHRNRVPEALEQAILEHALAHPCHGRCASLKSWCYAASRSPPAACAVSGSATAC
jgi:Helix-turn-helix domain